MAFIDNVLSAIEKASPADAKQHGVKGMKWGKRKPPGAPPGPASEVAVKVIPGKGVKTSGGSGKPASEDAVKAAVSKQVAKKSSVSALSNQELQALTQRMQLEANYKRLTEQTKSPGRQFIEKMLKNPQERDKLFKQVGDSGIGKQIGDTLAVGNTITKTDLSNIGK